MSTPGRPLSTTPPATELHAGYSSEGATARPWSETAAVLTDAPLYWLSTVRPDGRPHVTPLIGVWAQGALHFCTGPAERKARNLAANPEVVLTTGANALDSGFDVVVEGRADRVTDHARLTALAREWEAKYGADWHFDVEDGSFVQPEAGAAQVFAVHPRTVFGFGKGDPYSQTRYRFT
ncbi:MULTISPECIES: pyridoxamine 5'-phosphate oxidase family protein [Streptomyces]|uniref:pyridoxamine 5'-phosphate oxidase family protein n=1 Tax=Streptomyces TaxID=1883 RepID=UPI000D51716D|nr:MULTISPECIES: pyridoxamine 5'-phosphate oxidase family protein [Streptomyces]PVC64309.1 pyridoxamine 5'-phosphate oxidase [Streptomyces sp. CS065A]